MVIRTGYTHFLHYNAYWINVRLLMLLQKLLLLALFVHGNKCICQKMYHIQALWGLHGFQLMWKQMEESNHVSWWLTVWKNKTIHPCDDNIQKLIRRILLTVAYTVFICVQDVEFYLHVRLQMGPIWNSVMKTKPPKIFCENTYLAAVVHPKIHMCIQYCTVLASYICYSMHVSKLGVPA